MYARQRYRRKKGPFRIQRYGVSATSIHGCRLGGEVSIAVVVATNVIDTGELDPRDVDHVAIATITGTICFRRENSTRKEDTKTCCEAKSPHSAGRCRSYDYILLNHGFGRLGVLREQDC